MSRPGANRHRAKPKITPDESEVKLKLYQPHEGQWRMHQSDARFRVVVCGRRWGKTYSAVNEIVKVSWENPGKMCWWIGPTYQNARKAFDEVCTHFNSAIARKKASTGNMAVILKSGGQIRFQSAERPENLRGEGLIFLVVDEAAFVAKAAWDEVLRPMLSDQLGKALLIGTPKGRNWFYGMYKRGLDPLQPDYECWSFPTVTSPYILDSEVEEARMTLPADVFAQEYLAEFLEEVAGVFHGVEACILGEFEERQAGHRYVIGWDPAKHTDFSVITVIDTDHWGTDRIVPHVAHHERFNTLDYNTQMDRVQKIASQYGGYVLMDTTGLGDPLYDSLCARGVATLPFPFTTRSKMQIVQALAVAIESKAISYPEIEVLIAELHSYQYEITAAGTLRYSAPEGDHDDCVISLALANWAAQHPAWMGEPRIDMVDEEVISPI